MRQTDALACISHIKEAPGSRPKCVVKCERLTLPRVEGGTRVWVTSRSKEHLLVPTTMCPWNRPPPPPAPPPPPPPALKRPTTRGLHSFTSQLNLSALCGIGGARRDCVTRVQGVSGGL